jgi:hypothetical protein
MERSLKVFLHPPSGKRKFVQIVPENPVLWTGMKSASPESRKNDSEAQKSSA